LKEVMQRRCSEKGLVKRTVVEREINKREKRDETDEADEDTRKVMNQADKIASDCFKSMMGALALDEADLELTQIRIL